MSKEEYIGLFEIAKRLNISPNQAKWISRRYIGQIRFKKRNIKDKIYHFEDFKKVFEGRKNYWEEKIGSQLNQN
jgi:hypothetical protein